MKSVESAKEKVDGFVVRFDESYRLLAYYASLPLVLTPELINYLRNKFLQGKVPWVAEADLLLSDLFRPVGYEQYAMSPFIRAYLLREARTKLGKGKMREVALLLIRYIRHIARANPFLSNEELRTQQWAAMAYLDEHRETVVREIAESFRECMNPSALRLGPDYAGFDFRELGRLVKITRELTPELNSYAELIEYADCVGRVLYSLKTRELREDERLRQSARILNVELPAPNVLVAEEAAPAAEEDANKPFDFGAMLDQYEQEQAQYQEGSVVRGVVIGVNDRSVVIDFGYKTEGVAPVEDFWEDGELTVKQGDEVEVLIESMESAEGVPILSRADAVRMRAWDEIERAYRDATPVRGRIIDRVKGGLRVDVDGITAFLPGSQVDVRPVRNLDALRGQEIEARVIKINRKRSNVVLSRKAILEQENEGRKGETLVNLQDGVIVEGQIKNVTDYGAFIDLGGIDGLLHVTDMSWGRLQSPGEMFHVGETVQVKVLKFDRERERVSLGFKQLLPDPWDSVNERFPVGRRLEGRVASVTDYGAFVELEPGVEGLVHVSEMTWSKRMKHPSKLVQPGDTIEVEVLGVDAKNRRITLSMKQTQPNPWESLHERLHIGDRVRGRVRNLTDFGAFVEVEDGVDGLVHVSDISWNRRIKHPGELLKKGQEIEAVVTNIDVDNRRLSLSIKDTEPSAWEKFINEHKPGDIVRGKVTRFANFGVFVELMEGLEGLCHVSELSDERVDKPEDAVQIGQELDFLILRIELESKKIGLSHRATKHYDHTAGVRSYSTEAGGGMASLGELADLFNRRSGGGEEEGGQ